MALKTLGAATTTCTSDISIAGLSPLNCLVPCLVYETLQCEQNGELELAASIAGLVLGKLITLLAFERSSLWENAFLFL